MRRVLAAVYAVAALASAAPAVGFLAFAASSWSSWASRRSTDAAIAVLFNPMLIGSLGLATWFGSIAWRSAHGPVVGRRELRAAETLAGLLGALFAWAGVLGIEANRASAARGGGLLGGFGELTLMVGVGYLLLAACSLAARAFGGAAHARP